MLSCGNNIRLVFEQPQGSPHDALHHSSIIDVLLVKSTSATCPLVTALYVTRDYAMTVDKICKPAKLIKNASASHG